MPTRLASAKVSSVSNKFNIARRIKNLKIGEWFYVAGEKERQLASKECATLRRAGIVEFDVTTRRQGDGFTVIAIPLKAK